MEGQGDAAAAGAGGSQGPRPSNKRLQQTQAQVDEVVGIMKVNVEKVLERDQKLSQLDDRADALQVTFSNFLYCLIPFITDLQQHYDQNRIIIRQNYAQLI
ncbi:hypothetical protein Y032_0392g584 [Ancylostoma ceylanicum]|uniref:V-SNARE coiled-coil homology domain-containing protein n=1 Tax=Ancylostoma ceylanicum TaxID=53326 RepID=A0A016RRV1_9BILA|nr:hypothetical protein Y032_0392g584 [Ancylostoma ceylanicum]